MVTKHTHYYQPGDWVKFPKGQSRIELIGDTFASVEAMDSVFWELEDEIEPLPIKGEELKKNGWELKNGVWVLKSTPRLGWDETRKELTIGFFKFPATVEYYHQLQHQLHDLGIDEEIVLETICEKETDKNAS